MAFLYFIKDLLIPTCTRWASLSLFYINLIVFIYMLFHGMDVWLPSVHELLQWGVLFAPQIANGEWWRLLSSQFIHIGIAHFALNMLLLLIAGIEIEIQIGSFRLLLIYIISGLFSGAVLIWWNGWQVTAGASGALFGCFGASTALGIVSKFKSDWYTDWMEEGFIFLVLNLTIGIVFNLFVDRMKVANSAHIGGWLGGMVIGFAMAPAVYHRSQWKAWQQNVLLATASILVLCVGTYLLKQPREQYGEREIMIELLYLEGQAEYLFREIKEDDYCWAIEFRCLPVMERCKQLALRLGNASDARTDLKYLLLRDYVDFRMREYQLLTQGLNGEKVFINATACYRESKRLEIAIAKLHRQ